MGCYINPKGQTKEEWLAQHGLRTSSPCDITETHLPVCLVNSGAFTAAAIGFDLDEVRAFSLPSDHRPKVWYYVSREELRKVSPLGKFEEKK